ncbi:hypothetical protein [Saccharothrix sp. HUAS TT1]|uniref:hypothetical protein n=1 Tax=unclassified Saccharothrix TaxID=2593673 RepID=UPI00345B6155
MTAVLLVGGLLALLAALGAEVVQEDRRAAGPDHLDGWAEELAEIRRSLDTPTVRIDPGPLWIDPEDLPPALVRPYYLHHLEAPRGDA